MPARTARFHAVAPAIGAPALPFATGEGKADERRAHSGAEGGAEVDQAARRPTVEWPSAIASGSGAGASWPLASTSAAHRYRHV